MRSYQKKITVQKEDLDELQHVNNVRYVQWIQDISKEHWNKAVPENMLNKVIWVVLNHNITYKGAALLGQVIHLSTHIAETRGATTVRVVEMRNCETKELLVHSKTSWCLLNPSTFRPMRISSEIKAMFDNPPPVPE